MNVGLATVWPGGTEQHTRARGPAGVGPMGEELRANLRAGCQFVGAIGLQLWSQER